MTDPNASQPPFDNTNNDDDIFTDVEAEAAAMAAAMGFSSFGQQAPLADNDSADADGDDTSADPHGRPSKKRRYNSRVDAYVGPTPQGTGANDVPVQRRVFASKSERDGKEGGEVKGGDELKDENEINLDDDLDDNENPAAEASTTTTTLPINPSLPPKPQIQVSNQGFNHNNPNNQRGGQGHGGRGARGGGVGGRGGHGGGGTHGRDPTKPWYTDYYDPSSNENPWERLEQQRGMEAVGTWLPSRSGGGGGGRGGFGGSGSGQQGAQEGAQELS